MMFEEAYHRFWLEQCRQASGTRLERLQKDLTGEKKLLKEVIWPVLKSFDNLTLEYEIMSISGVKIYIDVYEHQHALGFESEGFVVHAENITRDCFMFERMRMRSMAMYGIKYVPFTWDELEKKAEICHRTVYELLGRFSASSTAYTELSVFEREILRFSLKLNRPLGLRDACYCLQVGEDGARTVLRKLLDKKLIKPVGKGNQRFHEYSLEEKVILYSL
ncbi:MAG TPA: hypothetical protein VGE40_03885 [Bacilli bacterium]